MKISFILGLFFSFGLFVQADTFTHSQTGKVYHGYATRTENNGKTLVQTQQEGLIELNLAEFTITPDRQGRNNLISVIGVKDQIQYELETAAFEKALIEESNKGPLFILIEIDSPGGRIDLARQMCSAIANTRNCQTVAFIYGGPVGGAYSAAAAVSLACNKIYMVPTASIGAATVVAGTRDGRTVDIKKALGETIGEKVGSVWRNTLAALAQQNGRPALLAKAMEDREIEVWEVTRNQKMLFIEAHEKLPSDKVVRIRCKKGELLTLPAEDAVACTMADVVVESRDELLKQLDAVAAQQAVNPDLDAAKDEAEKVIARFNKLNSALELKYKELSAKMDSGRCTKSQVVKDLQAMIKNAEYLLKLKQTYDDVPVPQEAIEELLNNIKASYQGVKAVR